MKARFRKFMLSCLAALLVCATGTLLYVQNATPISLEEAVVRAKIDESGPQAQAAMLQYPNLTPRIFALYGEEADFKKMMIEFGHNQTFPIIGICFETGDRYLDLEKRFGDLVDKFLGKPADGKKLDPEECGRKMISNIITLRNDYLQRFAIDAEKKAYRLDTVTALSSIGQFTTGGFQKAERKFRTNESVTLKDAGEVALDTLGFVGIAKLVLLPAKLGLAGTTYGVMGKILIVSKGVFYGGAAVTTYMAIAHPSVVTAWGGKVAEGFGYAPIWGQALIWSGPILVLLLVLNTIWFWTRPLYWLVWSPFKLYWRRKKHAV